MVFEILAYAAAGQLYWQLARGGDPLPFPRRVGTLLAAALGALAGSRLLGALQHPSLFFAPPSLLYYYANKTIVGGLLGGLVVVETVKLAIGEKRSTGDLLTFPLILGIGVGRIGCFFGGVEDGTVGVATSLPWGLDQGDGVVRHPTPLYEILFLSLLAGAIAIVERRRGFEEGQRFRVFLASYLAYRLAVDSIKPGIPLALGLTAIQWGCVGGLLWYTAGSLRRSIAKRRSPWVTTPTTTSP